MNSDGPRADIDALLAEQLEYYRARAPEYAETADLDLPVSDHVRARDAVLAAIDSLDTSGDVLELACGPGTWTGALLGRASTLTALDGSAEMLEIAAATIGGQAAAPTGEPAPAPGHKVVRFVQADLFAWEPDRRYDVVFFGFWLSHVPLECFEEFWALVDRCLKPGGCVAFVDDADRTAEELVGTEESEVVVRQLRSGARFRAVKVPHTPAALEERLRELGWSVSVRSLGGPFFWGAGGRAQ